MPTKRNKVNYQAAAHSDALAGLSAEVHKSVLKASYISPETLDTLIRLANDLNRELRPASVNTFDPFLTAEPKQPDVAKLPTISVPAVEKPKEEQKKSGFLGR